MFFSFILVLMLFLKLMKDKSKKNVTIYLYTIINIIITLILSYATYFLKWDNVTVFILIMILFNFLVFLMFEKIEESTNQ